MLHEESTQKPVIIFDCDGVIFDTNTLKTNAFGMVLRDAGFTENVVNAFITHHQMNGGISRYVKFQRLYIEILRKPLPPNGIEGLLLEFSEACLDLYFKADFTPGCPEILEKLSANYMLYLASGGDQNELRSVFRHRNIDGYFESIFGSPMSKSECVNSIICNVDIKYGCTMVGDSVSDWTAADDHGLDFIYMKTFSDDPETMSSLSCKHGFPVIENIGQLDGLL